MKTSEYLDLAIKKHDLRNDNQLSNAMGWGSSKVCNYRKNRQAMDNEAAREMAVFLDVPVWNIIADMEAMRAKDPTKKKAWAKLAKMKHQSGMAITSMMLTLILLASTIGVTFASTSTPSLDKTSTTLSIHYANYNVCQNKTKCMVCKAARYRSRSNNMMIRLLLVNTHIDRYLNLTGLLLV